MSRPTPDRRTEEEGWRLLQRAPFPLAATVLTFPIAFFSLQGLDGSRDGTWTALLLSLFIAPLIGLVIGLVLNQLSFGPISTEPEDDRAPGHHEAPSDPSDLARGAAMWSRGTHLTPGEATRLSQALATQLGASSATVQRLVAATATALSKAAAATRLQRSMGWTQAAAEVTRVAAAMDLHLTSDAVEHLCALATQAAVFELELRDPRLTSAFKV